MSDFVSATLGPHFIITSATDLAACFDDSSATTPLVFVLSQGSDPTSALLQFAGALTKCFGDCSLIVADSTCDKLRWLDARVCVAPAGGLQLLHRLLNMHGSNLLCPCCCCLGVSCTHVQLTRA